MPITETKGKKFIQLKFTGCRRLLDHEPGHACAQRSVDSAPRASWQILTISLLPKITGQYPRHFHPQQRGQGDFFPWHPAHQAENFGI